MSNFTKAMKNRIANLRHFHGVEGEVLKELLNDFERALDFQANRPENKLVVVITPAFKVAMNHNGEYHEEYFDNEEDATNAATNAVVIA